MIALLRIYPLHMLSSCQEHRRGGGSDIEAFDRLRSVRKKKQSNNNKKPHHI